MQTSQSNFYSDLLSWALLPNLIPIHFNICKVTQMFGAFQSQRTWEDGLSNQFNLWLAAGWSTVESVSGQILPVLHLLHIFQVFIRSERSGQAQIPQYCIICVRAEPGRRKVRKHHSLISRSLLFMFRHSSSSSNESYQAAVSSSYHNQQTQSSHHQKSHLPHYQSQIQRCYCKDNRWVLIF